MRRRIVPILIAALFITGSTFGFLQCSHDNIARVTIELQSVEDAQYDQNATFMDRVLSFFTSRAYAGDYYYTDTFNRVTIEVSGPGMDTVTVELPPTAGSHTLEVPAGSDRTFSVQAYDGDLPKRGGMVTTSLSPGDDSQVAIPMIPIPQIGNAVMFDYQLIRVYPELVQLEITQILGYNLYRSRSPEGEFKFRTSEQLDAQNYDIDDEVIENGTYYYRVSINTEVGESAMSRVVPVVYQY